MTDQLDDPDEIFNMETIYGIPSRQPSVKLTFRDEETRMSTEDARRLAADIIDTAHAADADAFLVEFLQEKAGLELEKAAHILLDFRQWRVDRAESNGG